MMGKTSIEWADRVWNPVTGCSKVSQGCKNCYAERIAARFWKGRPFTKVVCNPGKLDDPASWYKPRRVFVNSMSDLFHPDVDDKFIDKVFTRMAVARRHTFLILTKRPERMLAYFKRWTNGGWDTPGIIYHDAMELFRNSRRASGYTYDTMHTWPLPNVWLGVSAEDQTTADERIPLLLQTPAAVRFVSCEPLLGPVDLLHHLAPVMHVNAEKDLSNDTANALVQMGRHVYKYLEGALLDWVIAGGESGPGARPMHPQWAKSIKDQCQAAGVPFFFKQWGEWVPRGMAQLLGFDAKVTMNTVLDAIPYPVIMSRIGKKATGRELDGRTWEEVPEGDKG
jgi:protein gp37